MNVIRTVVVAGVVTALSATTTWVVWQAGQQDGQPLCSDLRPAAKVTEAIGDNPEWVRALAVEGASVDVGTRSDCGAPDAFLLVRYPAAARPAVTTIVGQRPEMDVAVGLAKQT